MKLFNLFKKKENVEIKEAEDPKAEVHIIEEPQMIKVKCIKNVTLNLDKSGAYNGENVGIVAGQATNSTLDNIKIDDCKIIKSNLLADTNIGFLCGKMTTNCVVKNVIIQNCFYIYYSQH